MIRESLPELQQEEKNLLALLSANRLKQKEINTEAFCKKLGVNIGDTIQFQDGRQTLMGVFTKIDYYQYTPNRIIATLFNSDGKLGKRERIVWNAESVKKLEPK
jgi:hypothetical protein